MSMFHHSLYEYKGGRPVPITIGLVPELPNWFQIRHMLEISPKLNIYIKMGYYCRKIGFDLIYAKNGTIYKLTYIWLRITSVIITLENPI